MTNVFGQLLYLKDLAQESIVYLGFSQSQMIHLCHEVGIDMTLQVKCSHCLQLVNVLLMDMKDTAESEKSSSMHHTSVSGTLYHC
jgi:hypothetical protein